METSNTCRRRGTSLGWSNTFQRAPFVAPDVAARNIVELANAVEPIQGGHIYVERINGPMGLFNLENLGFDTAFLAAQNE